MVSTAVCSVATLQTVSLPSFLLKAKLLQLSDAKAALGRLLGDLCIRLRRRLLLLLHRRRPRHRLGLQGG
jgi:hypothetical protein